MFVKFLSDSEITPFLESIFFLVTQSLEPFRSQISQNQNSNISSPLRLLLSQREIEATWHMMVWAWSPRRFRAQNYENCVLVFWSRKFPSEFWQPFVQTSHFGALLNKCSANKGLFLVSKSVSRVHLTPGGKCEQREKCSFPFFVEAFRDKKVAAISRVEMMVP